ncbi:VanZ family protein [Kribbella amoyensis]|uniref:VanZ family protein n=1 Tax=Kribbella amoyensis TaxID=996641 RepID=A0A561BTZ0_9ACTN|nr:VanZ family protein [Kribbella amoyensis]TWD82336.1 VanZ family protein [Kribbella amoyensis]
MAHARGRVSGPALRKWGWRGGFLLAVVVQLYGLYAPTQPGPPGIPYLDKVSHCVIFAAVAYLGLRARIPARWLLGALVAHAVVSELIQGYLLPSRSGDPFDALADVLGVAIGAWFGFRALRRAPGAVQKLPGTT